MKRSTPIFYAKSDYCQEKFPTCVSVDIGFRIRIISGLVLLVCSLRSALFIVKVRIFVNGLSPGDKRKCASPRYEAPLLQGGVMHADSSAD